MVRKWIYRFLGGAFILSLAVLSQGTPHVPVRAQAVIPRAYFPLILEAEPTRYDNFEDQDPPWQYKFTEPADGTFFHRNGRYVAELADNSANGVAWPGWRPLGDFKLEVDARFGDHTAWMNALGLVFAGNDQWDEYYAFMLGYNFAQHAWSFSRVEPPEHFVRLTEWGGVPTFVGWYDHWNHLMVLRVGDRMSVHINGRQMPGGSYTDGTYGTRRLVGVIATTFEWNQGEVEFDEFTLTPLSMPHD